MMATAFMGYVLPWGQMSFWAATVITNLFGAIPVVGDSIVKLLWGGFSVDNATLNRFFSLHYLLPFAITGAVLLHLAALHNDGSNNPLGINSVVDKVSFYPYFWVKDVFGWILVFSIYFGYVFFEPNMLGHPDNYIPANPMVTPAHIVPEWYFLPYYAILRSIPDKLGGVIAMFASLISLAFLPFLNTSPIRSSYFRPIHRKFFWLFCVDVVILGWLGGEAPEYPWVLVSQLATFYYFFYVLVIIPVLGVLERELLAYNCESR